MGVPTSEVGYTPAMPRREDHEVHKGHVVALEKKIYISILDRACGPQVVNQFRKHRILPHNVKRNLNFIQFILLRVAGNTLWHRQLIQNYAYDSA